VLQVKQHVDALRAHGGFARPEVMESLLRFWHVQNRSVRPEHRMVAHTGFIIVAHRVERAVPIETASESDDYGRLDAEDDDRDGEADA
jgi:tRNA (adenine57-N1/adenine58-N1)-methyltransferase